MENYRIIAANHFYSIEFGKIYGITKFKNENTGIECGFLDIIQKFNLPQGYLYPASFIEDKFGGFQVDNLEIFDRVGNSIGSIYIGNIFNLYVSQEFVRRNNWI